MMLKRDYEYFFYVPSVASGDSLDGAGARPQPVMEQESVYTGAILRGL